MPVILGWDTNDYGSHAVLVTGYWIGQEKWLITSDPGGGHEVSWNSLKAQQERNGLFEVGLCSRHLGPRSMKSITRDADGGPVVHQWTPEQKYVPVADLFCG